MERGYAPIGVDGHQVNLHHVLGGEPGMILEVKGSTHSAYLHGLIEDGNSFRNDIRLPGGGTLEGQYNSFRRQWWKDRAENMKLSL